MQCEYHIWIRSAGNVSISFFPLKGNRGRCVHCEGVQWKAGAEGGSSGSIQPERCVLLHSFYTLFAQKRRKRTTFAFYKQTQRSFTTFPAGFYYKYACIVLYSAVTAESVRAPCRLVPLYTLTVYTVTPVPLPQQKWNTYVTSRPDPKMILALCWREWHTGRLVRVAVRGQVD